MTATYLLEDGTDGAAASGMADVEAGVPMARHSCMLAESIGKIFIAALIAALALDEPESRASNRRLFAAFPIQV